MSYSFSAQGATKAEAIEAANKKFNEVLSAQPAHAADMPAARDAVAAFTNLLTEDPACDCMLSINGSVWTASEGLRQVSINISAGLSAPR